MTSTDFCYWLQGLLELSEIKELDGIQRKLIDKHLDMVMYNDQNPLDFCKFLKGYLNFGNEEGINSSSLEKIKIDLAKVLYVEPIYEPQQYYPKRMSLNPSDTSELIRC